MVVLGRTFPVSGQIRDKRVFPYCIRAITQMTKENAIAEIHVRLPDEGTDCSRPTRGVVVGNELFKFLPTDEYDPNDEQWEFLPGSIVRVQGVRHPDAILLLDVAQESDAARLLRFQRPPPLSCVSVTLAFGHRSSIFSRMRLAFSIASTMAHSRAGHGLTTISLSFLGARIVAAKRIAYRGIRRAD